MGLAQPWKQPMGWQPALSKTNKQAEGVARNKGMNLRLSENNGFDTAMEAVSGLVTNTENGLQAGKPVDTGSPEGVASLSEMNVNENVRFGTGLEPTKDLTNRAESGLGTTSDVTKLLASYSDKLRE